MVGWKPDRAETVRLTKPHPGQGDESMLYLWMVPAEVRGIWQSSDVKLRIHQNYQELEVEGILGGRARSPARRACRLRRPGRRKACASAAASRATRLVGDLLIDGRTESVVLTRAR